MADMDDDELLDALGVEVTSIKTSARTPREERIIAGFEDILRFHQTHGRAPQHGDGHDIFERLYAVRLEQIRKLPEAPSLLAELDSPGLLNATAASKSFDDLDEDALLAELGVDTPRVDEDDITVLKHVRSVAEKRAAEEVANRTKCEDFDQFKHLFDTVREELQAGIRQARTFQSKEKALDDIVQGAYFIIGGQIAYIAEEGEEFTTEYGRRDSRLRVVFDNGTEASVLMRSLQRSLHRDEAARLISDPDAGPLFGSAPEDGDVESGTIYVLRSKSTYPFVAEHRELIHKIGVTGGSVEARISGAEKDATYLLAGVEVVATYKLHNINRVKLEGVFHRLFGAAQIDLTIEDRFGQPVRPKEWFLVPLHVIDEAVQRIRDGSITELAYDPTQARLV
ncbi:MAG: GIY-YIG nuclease family protein [Burkholderiales bacterium]|nr:GIY-YIG nuclease family protein [Burkholderiales bacterium]